MKKALIIGIVAIIVIVVGSILLWKDAKNPTTTDPYAGKSSRDIVAACAPQEFTVLHIHPVLSIYINGQKQVIPANVGIEGLNTASNTTHDQAVQQATCLHAIHTHDASGTIHVESPVQMDFHLSDFFYVWGKTFTKDQILDNKVDATHRIRMTVNGQESDQYGDLVLHDGDQIAIYYEAK